MSDQFDPNHIEEKLKLVKNAADKSHFNVDATQDIKVNLRPDPSVKPAMFVPDPLLPGCYKAHPVTLRALRKNIFAAGNELFEDLEDLVTCESCQHEIDRQFWHFCPHCEAKFRY
ncbi:MAG: hypothetical protein CME71_05950 [Halobacteriovorax sp.]|nr:hypothetical protein [Halobacteriovorax sp.]|tara:strand:+ start:378 stop:722 length:345 start_codon:yes stop_codon:yes gene_type:complete